MDWSESAKGERGLERNGSSTMRSSDASDQDSVGLSSDRVLSSDDGGRPFTVTSDESGGEAKAKGIDLENPRLRSGTLLFFNHLRRGSDDAGIKEEKVDPEEEEKRKDFERLQRMKQEKAMEGMNSDSDGESNSARDQRKQLEAENANQILKQEKENAENAAKEATEKKEKKEKKYMEKKEKKDMEEKRNRAPKSKLELEKEERAERERAEMRVLEELEEKDRRAREEREKKLKEERERLRQEENAKRRKPEQEAKKKESPSELGLKERNEKEKTKKKKKRRSTTKEKKSDSSSEEDEPRESKKKEALQEPDGKEKAEKERAKKKKKRRSTLKEKKRDSSSEEDADVEEDETVKTKRRLSEGDKGGNQLTHDEGDVNDAESRKKGKGNLNREVGRRRSLKSVYEELTEEDPTASEPLPSKAPHGGNKGYLSSDSQPIRARRTVLHSQTLTPSTVAAVKKQRRKSASIEALNSGNTPIERGKKDKNWGATLPRNYTADGRVITFSELYKDHPLFGSLTEMERKRQDVIYELITTEKQYLNDLDTLIKLYVDPLQKKNLLSKKQHSIIFSNLEAIHGVNESLYKELDERSTKVVVDQIGDLLLGKSDAFKFYAVYCSNQDIRSAKLQKYRKKLPEFNAYLETTFLRPECRLLELESFLMGPLQRLCKYPLLIQQILKYTEPDNPDFSNLEQALQKIKDIIDIVNERTRQMKDITTIFTVQKKVAGLKLADLMVKGRALVKEGPVTRLKRNRSNKCYLFLFNDLLLITKVNEKKSYSTFTESRKMLAKAKARASLFAQHGENISTSPSAAKKAGDEPYILQCVLSLGNLFVRRIDDPKKGILQKDVMLSSTGSNSNLQHIIESEEGSSECIFEVLSMQEASKEMYCFEAPSKYDTDSWLEALKKLTTEFLDVALERVPRKTVSLEVLSESRNKLPSATSLQATSPRQNGAESPRPRTTSEESVRKNKGGHQKRVSAPDSPRKKIKPPPKPLPTVPDPALGPKGETMILPEDGHSCPKVKLAPPLKPLPPRPPQQPEAESKVEAKIDGATEKEESGSSDEESGTPSFTAENGKDKEKERRERRHAKKLMLKLQLKKAEYMLKVAERKIEDLETENEELKAELKTYQRKTRD